MRRAPPSWSAPTASSRRSATRCRTTCAARDRLEQTHASARRMAGIVDDLLALSHVSRGDLRRDSVDLTAIARRVVANLRLREPARNVEVSVASDLAATCDGRLVTI